MKPFILGAIVGLIFILAIVFMAYSAGRNSCDTFTWPGQNAISGGYSLDKIRNHEKE